MPEIKLLQDESTSDYLIRCENRKATLGKSTVSLIGYLMGLGDDYPAAKQKVVDLGNEIRTSDPGAKYDYELGNTQPLIDIVNSSTLPFMTAEAKALVVAILAHE